MAAFFSACTDSRKIAYFSDSNDSTAVPSKSIFEPQIQKKDIISIKVSSSNNPADIVYNMPNSPISNNNLQTAGYLVGEDGNIQFPELGIIKAEGLTQKQLETNIRRMLIDKQLLLDPVVSVRNLNFRVTVLGEVPTCPAIILFIKPSANRWSAPRPGSLFPIPQDHIKVISFGCCSSS